MKMFIILDMKKNKIDHFSLKIIVLTSIDYSRIIDRDGYNCPILGINVPNLLQLTKMDYLLQRNAADILIM